MSKNFINGLPEKFTRNTLDLCAEKGEQWLRELPRMIEELSIKWKLRAVAEPFPNLSYNFVAPCVMAGGDGAVLKIALPLEKPEIFNEARFLKIADGRGVVKLLRFDEHNRAMLLEKLTPGANLKEVFREKASETVEIAIRVMREILKTPPENSGFLKLEDWFKGLEKAEKTGFPEEFSGKARDFFAELSSPAAAQKFLIHGDLHHENILSAGREPFLVIDPKGIIGDPGYEISIFLNNHLWWLDGQPNFKDALNETVRQFSEAFEIEPQNLRKWAFAQMVLSAWWTYEDHGQTWRRELAYAEFWEV